jgi:hypothetical protein
MFQMVPIKEISVESKRSLEMEEEKVREEYKSKMNIVRAYVNDIPPVKSPESVLISQLNHEKKLQKYREENAEKIMKYKNDKPFLHIIKTRKYKPSDYKELTNEITFTE